MDVSDLLLLLLLIGFKRREYPAYLLLTGALAVSLKLLFRIPRDAGLDPFAFPSLHTALASTLFFTFPSLYTLIYTALVASLRLWEGYHALHDVLAGFVLAGGTYGMLEYLRDKLGREADRKAVHIGISVLAGFFGLFTHQIFIGLLLLLGSVLVTLARNTTVLTQLYAYYSRGETDTGHISLSAGLFLSSLTGYLPLAGLFTGYVDGLATLTGKLSGGRGKTIAGFLGGLVGGVFAAYLLRGFYPPIMLVLSAVLSPLVEYLSPLDDNLLLPLFLSLIALFTSRAPS